MNRVILGMAAMNYFLVVANALFGVLSRFTDMQEIFGQDPFVYHFLLGILTGLFSMLTHCLAFTYFLGTGRWVKETSEAYALTPTLRNRSRALRSKAMAAAIPSILLVVFTIASGAGSHTKVWKHWIHELAVLTTYTWMIWAFRVEIAAIEEHQTLTDEVMEEVHRIRTERGLPND